MSWLKKSKEGLKTTHRKRELPDGLWTKCEECGEIIGLERLKARPVTTLCIDCKSLQEAEERKLRGVH